MPQIALLDPNRPPLECFSKWASHKLFIFKKCTLATWVPFGSRGLFGNCFFSTLPLPEEEEEKKKNRERVIFPNNNNFSMWSTQ